MSWEMLREEVIGAFDEYVPDLWSRMEQAMHNIIQRRLRATREWARENRRWARAIGLKQKRSAAARTRDRETKKAKYEAGLIKITPERREQMRLYQLARTRAGKRKPLTPAQREAAKAYHRNRRAAVKKQESKDVGGV